MFFRRRFHPARYPLSRSARRRPILLVAVLALMLLGLACSGHNVYRQAQIAEQMGEWDDAVLYYLEAVRNILAI